MSKQKSWIERNWIKAGCGCCGGCGCLTVMMVTFVAGIFLTVATGMKSSDAYKEAMAMARANPEVVAALGEPVEAGVFLTGNINVNGPTGDADMAVPLKGPNGKGKLYIVATKTAGEWTFQAVDIELDNGRVDLLAGESP